MTRVVEGLEAWQRLGAAPGPLERPQRRGATAANRTPFRRKRRRDIAAVVVSMVLIGGVIALLIGAGLARRAWR